MFMRNRKKNERSNVIGILHTNAKSTFDVDHSPTLADIVQAESYVGNVDFESFNPDLNERRS